METKYKVGQRVQLREVLDVWAEVGGKGTVTAVSNDGLYTVKFDNGGTISGIEEKKLEPANE